MKSNFFLFFLLLLVFVFISVFGKDFSGEGFFLGSLLGNKTWQLIILGASIFVAGIDLFDQNLSEKQDNK